MTIEAEISDSTHLKLLQPIEGQTGDRLTLKIIDLEREEFLEASAAELERAYGDDEPDYSEAGVPIQP